VTSVHERERWAGDRAAAPAIARASTATGPRRWVDPALVGGVALVVYALHGYDGALTRDFGVFTYGGLRISHGSSPYVDIFNSVGPLSDAVPGLAIWVGHLVGADPIFSARLLESVISALCCALLCVLARDVLGVRAAGFVAPAVFLTFPEFLELASDGPRDKTTMVVFLLGCLVLLVRRRWFAAGACAALATLTWQPVLAVAAAALVAAVLLDREERRRSILVKFLAGGLVPSLVTVGYFLGVGALRTALDGFIVINAGYTTQPSLLTDFGRIETIMWTGYGWSLPLAIGGLVALVVIGASAVPASRRPTYSAQARGLVICAAGGLAGAVWTTLVVNGAADLFVVLPLAALGVAATVVLLVERVPQGVGRSAVVAVVSGSVLAATVVAVSTRDDRLDLQRADVAAVLATEPTNATVLSLSAPEVLALSGRTDPTPYQIMTWTQERYLSARYPGGLAGFLRTLVSSHPTLVAVGNSADVRFARPWLDTDYWRIPGDQAGWHWYLDRTAGPAALARTELAHDAVLAAYGN
jgi:hypothetical protein